jgi:hypothetical protein
VVLARRLVTGSQKVVVADAASQNTTAAHEGRALGAVGSTRNSGEVTTEDAPVPSVTVSTKDKALVTQPAVVLDKAA